MSQDPNTLLALTSGAFGCYIPDVATSGEVMWTQPDSIDDDAIASSLSRYRHAVAAFRMLDRPRYMAYQTETFLV